MQMIYTYPLQDYNVAKVRKGSLTPCYTCMHSPTHTHTLLLWCSGYTLSLLSQQTEV